MGGKGGCRIVRHVRENSPARAGIFSGTCRSIVRHVPDGREGIPEQQDLAISKILSNFAVITKH